jgi:divalent metal cation (Fe/Co/Zn/Cd) transporter
VTTPPATTDGTVESRRLLRRALRLEHLTIGWNAAEAVVAVAAGVAAGSVALVGFGFDSVIETFAAGVVVWRLRRDDPEREERALRLIAVSFFALAGYVTVQSGYDLATAARPDESPAGIVLTALSLVVMPLLAVAKRRTGHRMGSRVLVVDAAETLLCTYLSAIVLGGLALNAALGWWWADPIAALGVAYLAVREGREAWAGEDHCG